MKTCRYGDIPARPPAVLTVLTVLALVLLTLGAPLTGGAAAAEGPTAKVSEAEAGTGGTVTVTGARWRPRALLTLLICGQNMIGGTNSCANGDGRAVTVGADGTFTTKLPVAEPPEPCPCVIHIATVTGEAAAADVTFKVAGHPVAPLPKERSGGERLSVLAARLDGSSGLLTWFGAPPRRRLVVTVGNLGSTPARDPVFGVGTSHGVFAPSWEEQRWRGTVQPGKKARVELDVELSAGAHGDYLVSLRYGDKLLVEEPWAVGRPWGVALFWVLLCVVVAAVVFRIGMAVVNKVRPRTAPAAPPPPSSPGPAPASGAGPALPWFTPDTSPKGTDAPPDFRTVRGDPTDSERKHVRCDEE
ncbi:hypothetical protein [Streptomyces hygroscopicus]|uniref:hypothetical protein n=1 Tax=Streptomyces hygroscopicus TaxID=1912 RepID=UPI0036BE0789